MSNRSTDFSKNMSVYLANAERAFNAAFVEGRSPEEQKFFKYSHTDGAALLNMILLADGVRPDSLLEGTVSDARYKAVGDMLIARRAEDPDAFKDWVSENIMVGAEVLNEYAKEKGLFQGITPDNAAQRLSEPKTLAVAQLLDHAAYALDHYGSRTHTAELQVRNENPGKPIFVDQIDHEEYWFIAQAQLYGEAYPYMYAFNELEGAGRHANDLTAPDGQSYAAPRDRDDNSISDLAHRLVNFGLDIHKEAIAKVPTDKGARAAMDAVSARTSASLVHMVIAEDNEYAPEKLKQLEKDVDKADRNPAEDEAGKAAQEWQKQKLIYAREMLRNRNLYAFNLNNKTNTVTVTSKADFPDMDAFTQRFGKDIKVNDLVFFDKEGKTMQPGVAFARNGDNDFVHVMNTKTHEITTLKPGFVPVMEPLHGQDKAAGRRAADQAVSSRIFDANVEDKDLSKTILAAVKSCLDELHENQHWYNRSSDEYRDMVEATERFVQQYSNNPIRDLIDQRADMLKLLKTVRDYTTMKSQEADRSGLANSRLAAGQRLENLLDNSFSGLTKRIGGKALDDTINTAREYGMVPPRFSQLSSAAMETFANVNQARENVLKTLQTGEECHAQSEDVLLSSFAVMLQGAREGNAKVFNDGLQDIQLLKNDVYKVHLVDFMTDLKAGRENYSAEDFDRDFQFAGKYADVNRRYAKGEITDTQCRQALGMPTKEEKTTMKALYEAGKVTKEEAKKFYDERWEVKRQEFYRDIAMKRAEVAKASQAVKDDIQAQFQAKTANLMADPKTKWIEKTVDAVIKNNILRPAPGKDTAVTVAKTDLNKQAEVNKQAGFAK